MSKKWLEQMFGKITPMEKEWTHRISVGEPWNYEGTDGKNLILGKIIKTLYKDALLFESKNELEFDGHRGKYLLLHARICKTGITERFSKQ